MAADRPSVDIVIVNWNTGPLLAACVESILVHTADLIDRIIVVDNASTDASLVALAGRDHRITAVRNPTNRGFAAACNQGAAGSRAPYLLFLNPDTLLDERSISGPIAYLEDSAAADVAICGIRMVNSRGETEPSSRRFPSLRAVFGDVTRLSTLMPAVFPPTLLPPPAGATAVEVDQLIGAFFLVRRRVFDELGGFDERFFVYYEEVDFALRARTRGYRSMYLPSAAVRHHGGYSSDQVRGRRLFYSLRSRWLFARKHWPAAHAVALAWMTYLVEFPARVLNAAVRLRLKDLTATCSGYWALTVWALTGGRRQLP